MTFNQGSHPKAANSGGPRPSATLDCCLPATCPTRACPPLADPTSNGLSYSLAVAERRTMPKPTNKPPHKAMAEQLLAERDEERWESVRSRNSFSEAFVYAVRTTGVYCRPGCPSRIPRRQNVQFFTTSLDAESAGFRACKRCNPRSPVLEDRRIVMVSDACRQIEVSDTPPTLGELAQQAGLSESQFHRVFKTLTGATPKQYADAVQAVRVRSQLEQGRNVTEAIFASGFNSSSRFYEKWAWILGMKPATFGDQGKGELILYAIVCTQLGRMMVAATRVGVCSIAFADESAELEAELQRQFAKATILEGDEAFRTWVAEAALNINTPSAFSDLPLDIQGTVFMRRVWSALADIPAGATRSYAEIAAELGAPQAARAVGSACAKNVLAIAIPCHRAVRSDGGLGGYRWGLQRKQSLLENESQHQEGTRTKTDSSP